ncbi:hypothetical protein HY212_01175 [Candidatus Pacearchaeota archaeon]|nr:hypothetical protein [Candidatus Pacearchaeota archaeon]
MFNRGCSSDREVDVEMYFAALHSQDYNEMGEADRSYFMEIHQHLAICSGCNRRCGSLQEFVSTDYDVSKLFTPADFALFIINKQTLGRLSEN